MELSLAERLILMNQHRMMAKLAPEEAERHELQAEAYENGYALDYVPDNVTKDEFPEAQCREVIDILQMFRVLTQAADRHDISDEDVKRAITFEGFDGNEEPRQYGYAQYFVVRKGRFEEFNPAGEHGDLNSHMPRLDKYRSMLAEWKQSQDRSRLTEEDVRRIANAW